MKEPAVAAVPAVAAAGVVEVDADPLSLRRLLLDGVALSVLLLSVLTAEGEFSRRLPAAFAETAAAAVGGPAADVPAAALSVSGCCCSLLLLTAGDERRVRLDR